VTMPILLLRVASIPKHSEQLLEQAASPPGPTVLVPTVDIGVELVAEPEPQVVSNRLDELHERKRKLDVKNERWLRAGRSRKERLRLICRRTLWRRESL